MGPLKGGPQCHMLILRNHQVSCHYSVSMAILKWAYVAWRFLKEIAYVMSFMISLLSIGSMSQVNFEKWPCHCVKFRDQGPRSCLFEQFMIIGYVSDMNKINTALDH